MTPESMSESNKIDAEKDVRTIFGLIKVNGRIYDDRARRDTGFSKYHEQVYRDQLLANIRLLQYHRQLGCEDRLAYLQEKLALQALYAIYSFKLDPVNWSEASCSQALLQMELLEIINQPYGICSNSSNSPTKIASSESPLWKLSEMALELTRTLIDRNLLSDSVAKSVEDNFTNLVETICKHRSDIDLQMRTLRKFATLAHCLYKLFQKYGHLGGATRRLLSKNFICDCLFPLACLSTGIEYPMTIVDPIGQYELFISTSRLEEPGEPLVKLNRANDKRKGEATSAFGFMDKHPLPHAHMCMQHLIYKLIVSSNEQNQDDLIQFLEGKIPAYKDTDYSSPTDKEALMSSIVALEVLGNVRLQSSSYNEFVNKFVLPNLEQDCLPMKTCKFQLLRLLKNEDILLPKKVVRAYFAEFLKFRDLEKLENQHQKEFLVFVAVASRCLQDKKLVELENYPLEPFLENLNHIMQLKLIRQISILYLNYKMLAPLRLLSMVRYKYKDDESFMMRYERNVIKVIDSLLSELLVLLSAKDIHNKRARIVEIYSRLFALTFKRRRPLPDKTVEKFFRVAILDYDSSLRHVCGLEYHISIWNAEVVPELCNHMCTSKFIDDVFHFYDDRDPEKVLLSSYNNLASALKFRLERKTQTTAIALLDRILEESSTNKDIDTMKLDVLAMILGNFGLYCGTSLSLLSTGSESAANSDRYSLLFESPERIEKIYLTCKLIEDWTSTCIMSTLMSWPSPPTSLESSKLFRTWPRFIELAMARMKEQKEAKTTWQSIAYGHHLFALMAAFNHGPVPLETYLDDPECSPRNDEPLVRTFVRAWLEYVDEFLRLPDKPIDTFTDRSKVIISYQSLINIHKAHSDGDLVLIEGLTDELNSARRTVLKCLAELRQEAICYNLPLQNQYEESIRQLEMIGEFIG